MTALCRRLQPRQKFRITMGAIAKHEHFAPNFSPRFRKIPDFAEVVGNLTNLG